MKHLCVCLAMLLCSTAYAGDECCSPKASPKVKTEHCSCKPVCYCNPCKCTAKTSVKPKGEYCACKKCTCDPCECKHEPLSRRLWVEDVYTPGLWYWGYYVAVGDGYEFHYQRREVRNALSNFNSIVHVNYRHNIKLSNRPSVKVVYKP